MAIIAGGHLSVKLHFPMKRFFILLLSGLSLVYIQAVPWNCLFPQAFTLNLSLVFVISLGLYRPFFSSWFLAFLLGYVLDSLSGGPAGLMSLINLSALFIIGVARRIVLFEGLVSQAVLVFALSVSFSLSLPIATGLLAVSSLGPILKNTLTHSLLLVALSIPLFALLNKRCSLRAGPGIAAFTLGRSGDW